MILQCLELVSSYSRFILCFKDVFSLKSLDWDFKIQNLESLLLLLLLLLLFYHTSKLITSCLLIVEKKNESHVVHSTPKKQIKNAWDWAWA